MGYMGDLYKHHCYWQYTCKRSGWWWVGHTWPQWADARCRCPTPCPLHMTGWHPLLQHGMWHGTWDMGHVTSHWMTCYDGALPCLTITSGEILITWRPWLQNITECSTKSTDAKCLMFIVAIVTRIVFNTLIVTPQLCNAVSHHQALHYSAHHLSLIFLYKQQHSHSIIILICHSLHFNWSICWHRHTLQQVD